MEIKSIDEALTIICSQSPIHHFSSNNAQPKKANKAYNKIVAAMAYLKKNDSLLELKKLLNNKDYSIVSWAATYLIGTDTKLAINILEEIRDLKIQHISMDAKYTILEWESGDLELYFGE
ncbi:MAG: hypothetical protein JEZ09_17065 [Salinivirgaceae bacterium]|nr:hypothetical protein [Salinivirgaceae bacterium]